LPTDYSSCSSLGEAKEIIDDFLADFPFETEADRTHAVAMPLTAILRHSFEGPTPMFRFEAPQPGTGKTLLCQILSQLIEPHFSYLPATESNEEARKLITSHCLRLPAVTAFDNVLKFDSAILEQVLTTGIWKDRLLGVNKEIVVPVKCVWACTINNPSLSRGMARRTLRVRINANMENPEQRPSSTWRHPDIDSYMRNSRGQILGAYALLAKTNGNVTQALPTLGMYENCIAAVCPHLTSAGYNGFLNTYATDLQETVDEGETAIGMFVEKWIERFGEEELMMHDLVPLAEATEGFPVKRDKEARISTRSLGWVLRNIRGRVFAGYKVCPPKNRGGNLIYRLVRQE